MICQQLATLTSSDSRGVRNAMVNSFDPRALHHGASMDELHYRSDLSMFELDTVYNGKEASIHNMLGGGNGYPPERSAYNLVASVAFDSGVTTERRDLRALLAWQASVEQCKMDKARGATA
jgi:hypothetical protein